ncbi:unnamed protein product [Bursaphelenchus xylophilus]|uniref:(pine wood nematode) hypothetical protein n=1 Tax=Bursaphelenchus xylophilus TaxID=6326 RepID=A0A1I7RTL4_BURXY|nr:unnamed protein product [Bursaphelenchus xylophilus]CAG9122347.1 unnamed protein product [Bursaphelenchus xylophilus]
MCIPIALLLFSWTVPSGKMEGAAAIVGAFLVMPWGGFRLSPGSAATSDVAGRLTRHLCPISRRSFIHITPHGLSLRLGPRNVAGSRSVWPTSS